MIHVYIHAWPEHYVGGGGGGRHDFMALCVRLHFDYSTTWLSYSYGTGCLLYPDACCGYRPRRKFVAACNK